MKLSKRNAERQKAIRKALAAGTALGGLLAGLAAVAGCGERHSPANTMGSYPADISGQTPAGACETSGRRPETNAVREEFPPVFVMGKMTRREDAD